MEEKKDIHRALAMETYEVEDEVTALIRHWSEVLEKRNVLENIAYHKKTTNSYVEYTEGEYFLDCWQLEGPKSKFYDITIFKNGKHIYTETIEKPLSKEELKKLLQNYLSSEEKSDKEIKYPVYMQHWENIKR